MSLTQKSIIVTGGASGIGLALTRYFASHGHRIAILDVNPDTGPKAAAEVAAKHPQAKIIFKKCDVASWDEQATAFREVFHEHGNSLDIVMANAGVAEGAGAVTVLDLEEEAPSPPCLTTLNINLIGVIYTVKLATHYMNKKPHDKKFASRGSIICTASNAGLYPLPVSPLYTATKFGVVGLVRALASTLEQSGIQINALAPSLIETNIMGPDHSVYKRLPTTPMSTLLRAVSILIEDPSATGKVAEIHDKNVTFRPHHEYVDEETKITIDQLCAVRENMRRAAGAGQ